MASQAGNQPLNDLPMVIRKEKRGINLASGCNGCFKNRLLLYLNQISLVLCSKHLHTKSDV